MVFGVIGLLILLITFFDYKKGKRSSWLDVFLFVLTGIIGVFILLLWFAIQKCEVYSWTSAGEICTPNGGRNFLKKVNIFIDGFERRLA